MHYATNTKDIFTCLLKQQMQKVAPKVQIQAHM